jgi:hypothetical protein
MLTIVHTVQRKELQLQNVTVLKDTLNLKVMKNAILVIQNVKLVLVLLILVTNVPKAENLSWDIVHVMNTKLKSTKYVRTVTNTVRLVKPTKELAKYVPKTELNHQPVVAEIDSMKNLRPKNANHVPKTVNLAHLNQPTVPNVLMDISMLQNVTSHHHLTNPPRLEKFQSVLLLLSTVLNLVNLVKRMLITVSLVNQTELNHHPVTVLTDSSPTRITNVLNVTTDVKLVTTNPLKHYQTVPDVQPTEKWSHIVHVQLDIMTMERPLNVPNVITDAKFVLKMDANNVKLTES